MRLLLALSLAVTMLAQAQNAPTAKHDVKSDKLRKQNVKAANLAYQRALKLEKENDIPSALAALEEAAALAPNSAQYAQAVAMLREQQVNRELQAGNDAMEHGQRAQALARFNTALNLDPTNSFAAQRLHDAAAPANSEVVPHAELTEQSDDIQLAPRAGTVSLQFSGDTQALLTQVATSFGLEANFDDNFQTRAVTLKLEGADFAHAVNLATRMARAMWVARSPREIFFAADTPENHRQYDHYSLRTFYFPDLSSPQELNDISSALRGVFDIRYLVLNGARSTITLRAPKPIAEAASNFLLNLNTARPQVMIDVQAYEVDRTLLTQLGINIPLQFQLINISPALLAAAGASNIQAQINQIIASGGLTPANQAAIQALLAQLQAQQQNGPLQTLLNTPFITFGHGKTLFALTLPSISGVFHSNHSYVSDVKHLTLAAASGTTASLLIGTRFPVLTSSFSLPNLTGGASTTTAFPIFNYEDLGVTLKAKPQIHVFPILDAATAALEEVPQERPSEVTLDLDLAIKALSGVSFNSVPVISNRQFTGSVRLVDGESALVVGSISRSQQRSLTGLPLLGQLPVIGRSLSVSHKDNEEDEIMIILTPHVTRLPDRTRSTAIWLPSGQ